MGKSATRNRFAERTLGAVQIRIKAKARSQSLSVAAILRQGGHWTQRQLLEALGVDPTDYEAMQIVRKQLDVLVDAEFIAKTAKGWRWI